MGSRSFYSPKLPPHCGEPKKEDKKMKMETGFDFKRYGCTSAHLGSTNKSVILSKVHRMTLAAVKNGERDFFAATAVPTDTEGIWDVKYHDYTSRTTECEKIKGIAMEIPAALKEIFPELCHETFFMAEVQHWGYSYNKEFIPDPERFWIIEYLGDNQLRRWTVPVKADLSTRQIIALVDLLDHECDKDGKLEKVEFGAHAVVGATKELARRSELARESTYEADDRCQATAWLAENFVKSSDCVEWLQRYNDFSTSKNDAFRLENLFPHSQAAKFSKEEPVTGAPDQWDILPAIFSYRKEVRVYGGSSPTAYMPNNNKEVSFPVKKNKGEGYFRVREDGRIDLFLKRGSRELGEKGWLWVLINPQSQLEAALDPMNNYSALKSCHTPLVERICRAYARAVGN